MSGHSKWSTIKRKKAANDAKRGTMFTRLAREIAIAAREGGDPEVNFALRLAIERAKASNMPKDNIARAIRRGTGEDKEGALLEQAAYEAYAPHGVALMIDVVTDNRNRTIAELRHLLTKAGSTLADAGSVSWQFERAAYFAIPASGVDADEIFDAVVEEGAEDVIIGEDDIELIAPVETFKRINDRLEAMGVKPSEARLKLMPNSQIGLPPEQALQIMRLIEDLEDLDDVQQVFTNLEVTEEAVTMLETA